jgi:ABC-type transport system substrate-binding protein
MKYNRILLMLTIAALAISTVQPLALVNAEDQELFKVTIIAPGNANMLRRQWGQMIANSFKQIGIDARVVFLGWAFCYERVLTPPYDNVGKTWDDGGYDLQLIGWTPGLNAEPRQNQYGGDPGFFAPDGQNYYLWNNTRSNQLLDTFITTANDTERELAAKAWQSVFFEEVPSSQIMYQDAPAVISPRILNIGPDVGNGPGWLYFNVQPNPEYLKINASINPSTTITYCSTGEIESLLPPLSNSWYDTIINAVIYGGLVSVSPDLSDLTVPYLLDSWESTPDGFNLTFHVKQGVAWHDGAKNVTADDIMFSMWALMNPAVGSQFVGYYRSVYGDNVSFRWENGTTTTLGNGTRLGSMTAVDNYTVSIRLPVVANGKPYGYFDPYLFTFANNIIPYHVFSRIPAVNWTDSCFNTGQGTYTINYGGSIGTKVYRGPVGCGPYMWDQDSGSFNPLTQTVTLKKFNNYWNRTALEAEGMFQATEYKIKFVADKTGAIASLRIGEVDMLDANYQMQVDVPTFDEEWGVVLDQKGTGRQEVGYNMRHPIFGTGVDTPLGKANASRAAEAARYVRQAFDYAIPRELIIENLVAGYGDPGATPMLPTQPYYNTSIAARSYNLTKARELLAMAGYSLAPSPVSAPPFIIGNARTFTGVFSDEEGVPVPNTTIELLTTTDNETGAATGEKIATTKTDADGTYSFTVAPSETGTFHYYIRDPLGASETEKYIGSLTVETLDEQFTPIYDKLNMLTYLGIGAIVIAIVIGCIAIYFAKKKP